MTWHEEVELGVHGGRSVHTDWVRDVAGLLPLEAPAT